MEINYEYYENPDPSGNGKRKFHPRVVSYNKISTDQLVREIEQECTLTRADVKAALSALADKMVQHLCEGSRVYLEDIGYFQINLQSHKEIAEENLKEPGSVSIKSVSFRADKRLKKALTRVKVHRSNLKPHSMPLTDEQVDARLTEHFATAQILTRRQFQFLCQQQKTTACSIIKRLVEKGKLKNIASRQNPVYVPVEGWYGK